MYAARCYWSRIAGVHLMFLQVLLVETVGRPRLNVGALYHESGPFRRPAPCHRVLRRASWYGALWFLRSAFCRFNSGFQGHVSGFRVGRLEGGRAGRHPRDPTQGGVDGAAPRSRSASVGSAEVASAA